MSFFFIGTPNVYGSDDWQTKARVEVDAPGIVEAILPPELYMAVKDNSLDLLLSGPDGRPRSFELYWREPVGRAKIRTTWSPASR